MPAYVIFNYKVLNHEKIDEFSRLSKPINEKYQAELLVASPAIPIEGTGNPNIVIYKFDNFESANRWYESDERKQIAGLRDEVLEGWGTIVPDISETEAVALSGYFRS